MDGHNLNFPLDSNPNADTKLPSYLVEFDLDAILEYANAVMPLEIKAKPGMKSAKNSGSHTVSELDKFKIIDRRWVTESPSAVPLDASLISQYIGGGVSHESQETFKISIDSFDFRVPASGEPSMVILKKQKGRIKKGTLLSLHVPDSDIESEILAEIDFITARVKKCKAHFIVSGMLLDIKLFPQTQLILIGISYRLEIVTLFHRYFSSDITQALDRIIQPCMEVFPYEGSEFNMSFESLPKDNQLFYRVVTEKTGCIKTPLQSFDHTCLQKKLLPFQRKSVGWLLGRENVQHDEQTQKSIPLPVITRELHEALISYPNTDVNFLAQKIHQIFFRLCYGWKRISYHGIVCWYNNYTGNIMLELQSVNFLKEYYEENEPKHFPGCGLLSEEMGLGKTVEVTTLIQLNPRPSHEVGSLISLQLKKEGDFRILKKAKTTLIAAPESIIRQWYAEICQICPTLLVTIYHGQLKYPELSNIPQFIAEFLQSYDVVLVNYFTLSRETDFANYSSRHKPTRGGKKRNGEGAEIKTANEIGEPNRSGIPAIDSFKAEFHIPDFNNREEVALSQKKYERNVVSELARKIARIDPKNIAYTEYYESPLMSCQWWRVVLDEVQMVSTGSVRAFETASLLPRFHSWGVSGTPSTLPAVLKFLKFLPFNYDSQKYCWNLISSSEKTNSDFVEVWLSLAIRHTKNMVHEDIKLPPQQRILLTIPLTEVEQDKYKEVLESTLAFIGIYDSQTSAQKCSSLDNSSYTHLRTCLLKLRQLCGNLQVGKLPRAHAHRGRNKLRILMSSEKGLKTLENVLVDMIESVEDDVSECERALVNSVLEICQALEYVYQPEKVIEVLDFLIPEVNRVTENNSQKTEIDKKRFKQVRAWLMKTNAFSREMADFSDYDSEYDIEGDELVSRHSNFEIKLHEKSEDDKELQEEKIWAYMLEFRKLKERLIARQTRFRSWKLLQHKCYFFLASAFFQLYDPVYEEKINNFRVNLDVIDTVLDAIRSEGLKKGDLGKISNMKKEPILGLNSQKQSVESRINGEEHTYKSLETHYYALADECRKEILHHAMNKVEKITAKRIKAKNETLAKNWINNGKKLLPKTTKHLFITIPRIETSHLSQLSRDMKCKQLFDQFQELCLKLNLQAQMINQNMQQLLTVLTNPLSSDKKDANGEEFDQSAQDQEKASCLMFVISQMLQDRASAVLDSTSAIVEIERHQENDLKLEAQKVSDKSFLKALLKSRIELKPHTSISMEDLIDDSRLLESEYKRAKLPADQSASLDKLALLRAIFENEKTAESLLKKELKTTFNMVFNSRVEYFRQLQYISFSVENCFFKTQDQNEEVPSAETLFNNLHLTMKSAQNTLAKQDSRSRYLATLQPGYSTNDKDQDGDNLICIICRSEITVGSLTFCGHKFCKDCLGEWFARSSTCPMCKTPMDRQSVYIFTNYRGGLKAQNLEVAPVATQQNSLKERKNVNQIYKQLDEETLLKVQNVFLSNSFGSKVDLIVKQVLYLRGIDPGVQIVVFSQWQDLLVILAFAFEKMNITYTSAKGSHVMSNRRLQIDPVEEFKDQTNIKTCFLLNAQAQSSGLTLINAKHIFLCEPLTNTSTELQAISRIHRIGQTKPTTVWMFCVENTVEESIVAIGAKRRLEYLEANAKEGRDKNVLKKTQIIGNLLEDSELRAAESFALTVSSAPAKKFSETTEVVTDEDLREIYFGSNTKQII